MPFGVNYNVNELPDWLRDLFRSLAEKSASYKDEPYQRYEGQRIAEIPEDITRAHEIGRTGVGADLPYYRRASELAELGSAPFMEKYREYMNPYQREVVDNIRTEGMRTFDEHMMPRIRAEFVGAGHLGGSRYADTTLKAARHVQDDILKRQQEALASGYQQAGQLFNADKTRQLETAKEMGNIGGSVRASNLADIATLGEQGRYQQQQKQTGLDTAYQDFLREKNFPMERLGQHASLLSGVPQQNIGQNFTQVPGAPQTNILGQIGSLAGNIYGARMMAKKRGGLIRKKKKPLSRVLMKYRH